MADVALPDFPYHPDPLTTGAIRPTGDSCCACGQSRGYLYTLPLYTAQDVPGQLCPWCIAGGTAAHRFEGQFTDASELSGLPEPVVEQVACRTPVFNTWQERRWLHHCGDAAAFLRPVGIRELREEHPDALETLVQELRADFHDHKHLARYLEAIDANGNPTAYLFRCRHCATHLAYTDCT